MLIFIGGMAAPDETDCYPLEAWNALFDALSAGDHNEAIRMACGERPTMLLRASMRPLATEDPEKHATKFWKEYAERNGAPPPVKHGETSYSVTPGVGDEKTNAALRRIVEGPKK